MSYADLITSNGTQTLKLPREYMLDADRVSVEYQGESIVLTPMKKVKPRMTIEQLFAKIDEALGDDGDFVIDRSNNVPPQPRELF